MNSKQSILISTITIRSEMSGNAIVIVIGIRTTNISEMKNFVLRVSFERRYRRQRNDTKYVLDYIA